MSSGSPITRFPGSRPRLPVCPITRLPDYPVTRPFPVVQQYINELRAYRPQGRSKGMSIKKKLMELMWRMQQSQTIIGVLMWSLTLTGIFYPYLRDKFGLAPSNVLLPMVLLFLFILSMVVLIGIVFDKLRFWKEQNIVVAERNPYATYKFFPKEVHWARLWLLVAKNQKD